MSYNSNYFSIANTKYSPERYSRTEPVQKLRGEFSKDRDRIMYSKSFRRLSGKTQIFLSTTDEDIRSRLTHTLEVNQIAKTIAMALSLNVELVEAIAFGHDIGHTPFGHVGERTLNHIMNGCIEIWNPIENNNKGFKHNLQALRILCELECIDNHKGLNLSKYSLWGIANHSGLEYKPCAVADGKPCYETYKTKTNCSLAKQTTCLFYDKYLGPLNNYWSFEGWIVAMADEIAQRHHDIEDSIRYNLIGRDDLLDKLNLFHSCLRQADKQNLKNLQEAVNKDIDEFLRLFARFIVNFYVVDVIETTKSNLKDLCDLKDIKRTEDFKIIRQSLDVGEMKKMVSISNNAHKADVQFQSFLKNNILGSYMAQSMDGKGQYIIRRLFEAYMSNPAQMPDYAISQFFREIGVNETSRFALKDNISGNENKLMRVICDFIGSMTDSYAYQQFDILYGTRIR